MISRTGIEELAAKIRSADASEEDDVRQLCEATGILDDYKAADGDTVESVILAAAKAFGVEVC